MIGVGIWSNSGQWNIKESDLGKTFLLDQRAMWREMTVSSVHFELWYLMWGFATWNYGYFVTMRVVERKQRKSPGPAEIIEPLNNHNHCLLPDFLLNARVKVSMPLSTRYSEACSFKPPKVWRGLLLLRKKLFLPTAHFTEAGLSKKGRREVSLVGLQTFGHS